MNRLAAALADILWNPAVRADWDVSLVKDGGMRLLGPPDAGPEDVLRASGIKCGVNGVASVTVQRTSISHRESEWRACASGNFT